MNRIALFIAGRSRSILKFTVSHSSENMKLVLNYAGVDVEGLTCPEPSELCGDRASASSTDPA